MACYKTKERHSLLLPEVQCEQIVPGSLGMTLTVLRLHTINFLVPEFCAPSDSEA